MPTYCVRFRGDKGDQCIEAHGIGDIGDSYRFWDGDENTVALVPKETVLSVVEETADGRPNLEDGIGLQG